MTIAKKIGSSGDVLATVSQIVTQITGVQLGDKQRAMVETRLKRRMHELKIKTEEQYLKYVQDNAQSETQALVSLLTTHHSYFFREFAHFEYLERHALPEVIRAARERGDKKIRVWSAACSRGQEVYSLSMFLAHHLRRLAPDCTYEVWGSDVDKESVALANNGVYLRNEIKEVPLLYIENHWARGTGDIAEYVKAKKTIKDHTKFFVANLLDFSKELNGQKFDVVFCRNVFIYFTADQVKKITSNLLNHVHTHGYFFIGISESLYGMSLPVQSMGPSIYRHKVEAPKSEVSAPSFASASRPSVSQTNAPAVPAPPPIPDVLRVLCVDDSPSVLTLMKQILKKENGFEVCGTAINGFDATKKVKELKPDLITLDIHMPEQDGIEYLRSNMASGHPPVVMVTSVSRENADVAMQALKLGASDYVEKPALANLTERGDEIRTKLRCAFRSKVEHSHNSLKLDNQFKAKAIISHPEKKLRLALANISDRNRLKAFAKELTGDQPPTVVLVEGSDAALEHFVSEFGKEVPIAVKHLKTGQEPLAKNTMYFGDFKTCFDGLKDKWKVAPTVILVYGESTQVVSRRVPEWSSAFLIVEDLGAKSSGLKEVAADIVPVTSFAYNSCKYLSENHV